MGITARTPPDNFVRLDTTINATGSWANARDLTVLRENHNKLLAERTKHTVFTMIGSELGSIFSAYPVSRYGGDSVVQVPVRISDGTEKLRVCVYAKLGSLSTAGDDDVYLYPTLTRPGARPYISDTTEVIQITSTSNAMYECDCTVIGSSFGSSRVPPDGMMIFNLFMHGGSIGADVVKAAGVDTFDEVGDDYFVSDSTTAALAIEGSIVYDLDDLEVEPRLVVELLGDKGFIRPGWSKKPAIGDLSALRTSRYINIQSICAYEKDASSI